MSPDEAWAAWVSTRRQVTAAEKARHDAWDDALAQQTSDGWAAYRNAEADWDAAMDAEKAAGDAWEASL